MRHVDVVIPVYQGYAETAACLRSVLDTIDPRWARLLIINDCSPDPAITDHLRELAQRHEHVVLLENFENLGFVASVNRGMAYDKFRDVLLLNSDVEVAGNWLERLREAAYSHQDVASVTPFSNNATVCSFPEICENNSLPFDLSLAEVDAQFAAEFTAADAFQVPTGVGCCMYLRRDCLDMVGYFDVESFGRGYGEENDWCQRAMHVGRRNLHLANCYVYHRGGVSFGAEYSPRLAQALDILDRKYPRYHGDIQRYIARDPARACRVRAWLRLVACQDKPKVLMVSHKLGGGAQQHVDELARLLGDRALFLFLVPDKDGETVRLSCFDRGRRLRDGLFFEIGREYDQLVALLRGLGIGRVHFHHTMGLPTRLWTIARDLDCGYDFTVHDYYLVNGNPALTDRHGRYVAEDRVDFDEQCAGYRPLPDGVDADMWRRNQRMIVEGADRVIFPSGDCADRFLRYFRVQHPVVSWHPDFVESSPYPAPDWAPPERGSIRVLIVGALSKEKGADLLDSVAASMVGEGIEFHLLGYAYRRLGSQVIAHGPYDNRDVYSLIGGIAPHVVWFPAPWPETYSYTLSIALHMGLPVVVPDIGAFRERVRGRPHSVVTRWDKSVSHWRTFWLDVVQRRMLPESEAGTEIEHAAVPGSFYDTDYLAAVPARRGEPEADLVNDISRNLFADSLALSRSERLLEKIWRFSLRPLGARLIGIVPFRVQRTIKRTLSQRPMHDIVGK